MSNNKENLRESTALAIHHYGLELDQKTRLAVDLKKCMVKSDKDYHQKRRMH